MQNSPVTHLTQYEAEIHTRALKDVARLQHTQADLLETVGLVDKHQIYGKFGLRSTFGYCVEILRLSEDIACNFITVARKASEVPALRAAIRTGALSLTKARKICSVLTAENQKEWIEKAKNMTQSQLEQAVAKVNPREAVRERASYVTETRMKLELGVEEEIMVCLRRVQDIVSEKEGKSATLEDTLKEMIGFYLYKNDPLEKARRARPLAREEKTEEETEENIREAIPASLRHEVNLRDQRRCQAKNHQGEICGATRWLHFHHLTPVSRGGENTAGNLTTLCSFHHQLLHRTENLEAPPAISAGKPLPSSPHSTPPVSPCP